MAASLERQRFGLRGRIFGVVTVLIVLLPLLIFSYSYMLRRELFPVLVKGQMADSLGHCYRIHYDVGKELQEAHRMWFPGVPLEAPGANRASVLLFREDRDQLANLLRVWFEQTSRVDSVIRSARIVDSRGSTVTSIGEEDDGHRLHVIEALPREHPVSLLDRLVAKVSQRQHESHSVFIPLRLGGSYVGGMYFGLTVSGVVSRADEQISVGTQRLLRMSLFGTAFLALLALYIVRLNDQTRDLQTQLEQEKQMASVGRLAAGLAHEVRTPLNALGMNLQMLQDRLAGVEMEDADYINRRLDYICREAGRLEVSVDDFLALAKPSAPHMTRIDVNRTVDEVVEFVRPQCSGEGVEIVCDYDETSPDITADPAHIGQAMQNLIRNARQAITEGGRITVSTHSENGYVELCVGDSGPGIPKSEREKVFEVFHTTKSDGTGLGLSIVKRIVEEHGGEVIVDEAPDGGAMFTLRFPVDGLRKKRKGLRTKRGNRKRPPAK